MIKIFKINQKKSSIMLFFKITFIVAKRKIPIHCTYFSLNNMIQESKYTQLMRALLNWTQKCLQNFWWILIYWKRIWFYVCTTTRSRQKICVFFFCKYYYCSLRKHWPTSGQSIKIHQKFWSKSSFEKICIYMWKM